VVYGIAGPQILLLFYLIFIFFKSFLFLCFVYYFFQQKKRVKITNNMTNKNVYFKNFEAIFSMALMGHHSSLIFHFESRQLCEICFEVV